jgi:hypothetical protein
VFFAHLLDLTPLSDDWTANLVSLDVGQLADLDGDGLLSLDGDDAGDGYTVEAHGTVADVPVTSYGFSATSRSYEDCRMVGDAREHLRTLPAPGETRHLLLGGRYTPWSLVPAVYEIAGQPIAELTIATLSYSQYNAADLIGMVDRGEIGNVTLLIARMFSSKNPELFRPLADTLRKRGHRVTTYRTHAKIFLFKLADGRCYTVEGSANLRSCKCVEQCCMTQDAGLYEWHRQWIAGVFDQVGEQN